MSIERPSRSEAKEWARSALDGIVEDPLTAISSDFSLDESGIRDNVQMMIDIGVDGLAIGGNIGEAWNMSFDDWSRLLEIVAEEASGQVQLWAIIVEVGVGPAVAKLRIADTLGYTGAEVMTPGLHLRSDEHHHDFFASIATETDLPIVLYRVPTAGSLTGLEGLKRIASIDTVVGMKQASQVSGESNRLGRALPEIVVMEASERFVLLEALRGGPSVVFASPVYALYGKKRDELRAYLEAAKRHDWGEAWTSWLSLEGVAAIFQDEVNNRIARTGSYIGALPVLKAWYEMVGFHGGELLPPLTRLSDGEFGDLREKLSDLDVI